MEDYHKRLAASGDRFRANLNFLIPSNIPELIREHKRIVPEFMTSDELLPVQTSVPKNIAVNGKNIYGNLNEIIKSLNDIQKIISKENEMILRGIDMKMPKEFSPNLIKSFHIEETLYLKNELLLSMMKLLDWEVDYLRKFQSIRLLKEDLNSEMAKIKKALGKIVNTKDVEEIKKFFAEIETSMVEVNKHFDSMKLIYDPLPDIFEDYNIERINICATIIAYSDDSDDE